MPGEREASQTCRDAGEETRVISVNDNKHLEDALGTVLENGVDRLNGLDFLQFVAHFMAWQGVDAFKEIDVSIWQAHQANVPENRGPHGLSP